MDEKIKKKRRRRFFAVLTSLIIGATSLSVAVGAYKLVFDSYGNKGYIKARVSAEPGETPVNIVVDHQFPIKIDPTCLETGKAGIDDYITFQLTSQSEEVRIGSGDIEIPAHGHLWDDGVVIKEATLTSNGIRKYTCTYCGETRTALIIHRPSDTSTEETTTPEETTTSEETTTTEETTTWSYYEVPVYPPETTTTPPETTTTTPETTTTLPETTPEPEETTTPDIGDDTTTPPEPQDGDVIELTDPVVPAELLEQIKGKDVDVVIDLGNGLKWTINGKSITDDDLTDINLNVSIGDNGIPVQVINKVTGERFYISIHLDYDGPFPFDAELEVDLKKSNAGYYANLFYYNPELSDLEYVSSSIIDENGVAHLNFHHASDYTIVIDDKPFDGYDDIVEDSIPEENPATGVIPAGISVAAFSTAAILILRKRKD